MLIQNDICIKDVHIWVFPKIGKHPKMDGENNGFSPINPWMIWGENPLFSETSI